MSDAITPEQVRHVAMLGRLHLSDEEVQRFAHQLGDVLDYVSKLDELELDDVEPMSHAMDVTNVLREDEPAPGLSTEAALANAPQPDGAFFGVIKVLGEGAGA